MTREEALAIYEKAKEFNPADCRSASCRRMGSGKGGEDWFSGSVCVGYHCHFCAAPTGMLGHPCEVRDVLTGGAE